MGVTQFSVELLERAISFKKPKNVLELGSQNLYLGSEDPPPFASKWYSQKGIEYFCIDLAGDNGAMIVNLAYPMTYKREFDLVTDFGTSEHVIQDDNYQSVAFHDDHIHSVYPSRQYVPHPDSGVLDEEVIAGYYNCWLNKFNLCKIGGIIISENPITGQWPEHGYVYLGADFYGRLAKIADLGIVETGIHASMVNAITGKAVYSILVKTGPSFPTQTEFSYLPIYNK